VFFNFNPNDPGGVPPGQNAKAEGGHKFNMWRNGGGPIILDDPQGLLVKQVGGLSSDPLTPEDIAATTWGPGLGAGHPGMPLQNHRVFRDFCAEATASNAQSASTTPDAS